MQANPGVDWVDMASHSTGNVLVRAYIQSSAYDGQASVAVRGTSALSASGGD